LLFNNVLGSLFSFLKCVRTNFLSAFLFTQLGAGIAQSVYSDWLRAERLRDRSSSPGRVKNILYSTSSRQVLEPTQSPIQWKTGGFSLKVSSRFVKLTTQLQLVPRSRIYAFME
jgi:hypothetical protein